jgi:tetratricopeptide (TPR) repeat protein
LILDNADDKAVFSSPPSNQRLAESGKQIREFLPQSSNGSILVTSRSRDAGFEVTTNYKHVFAVEQMTEDEALTLLQSQLDDTHPVSEQKTLVEKLGYVPLAISQAAANISRRSLPIPEYIKELDKVDEPASSLLDDSLPQLQRDASRSNSVVATWKVTFEYVRRCAPSAARLLSLMSLFARQDIPAALVEAEYGAEVIAAAKVRKVWWKRRLRRKKRKESEPVKMTCSFEDDWLMLRDFSLIKMNRDRRHFSMHPIVQFSTKRWLVEHEQLTPWSHRFIAIINTHFPDPELVSKTLCEPLFPHLVAAIKYRPDNAASQALQLWAAVGTKGAAFLAFGASNDSAETLYYLATKAYEATLGPSAPETLHCYSRRSALLLVLGRHDEALVLERGALRIRTETQGPEHADTLRAMDDVGYALEQQKRHKEAEEMYVGAMNIRVRTLGAHDESALKSVESYGLFLCCRCRYNEAYAMWRRAHVVRMQGKEGRDEHWAEHISLIGLTLLNGGKAGDAEKYLREVVEENEKGQPNEKLMKNLKGLADALLQLEKYVDAAEYFRRVVEWYDEQNSSTCSDQLDAMWKLAYVLCQLERLDEAEPLAKRCLVAQTESLGARNAATLASMWVLAGVWEKQGRWHEALELFKQCFDDAKDVLGKEHEDTKDYQRDYDKLLEKVKNGALNANEGRSAMLDHGTCCAIVGKSTIQDIEEDTRQRCSVEC